MFLADPETKEFRYIYEGDDGYYEFQRTGRGVSTEPRQIHYPSHLKRVDVFEILNGMLKNPKIFDESEGIMPSKSILQKDLGEYRNKYFDTRLRFDVVKEELSKIPIVRNKQTINYLSLPKFKHTSARADIESLLKIIHLTTEFSYETFSNRDNRDHIIGIPK